MVKESSASYVRRVEEKAGAKGIWNQMVTFRMESPPTNKPVPINMPGWVMMDENQPEMNVFWNCPLVVDRPGSCSLLSPDRHEFESANR